MITYKGEKIEVEKFQNICYQGTTYLRSYEVIYGEANIKEKESYEDTCTKENIYEIEPTSEVVIIRETVKVIGMGKKRTVGFYIYNNGWKFISPQEIN